MTCGIGCYMSPFGLGCHYTVEDMVVVLAFGAERLVGGAVIEWGLLL